MTQFPSNALDPSSQPWAREIERQLREVQGSQVQEASLRRNSADGVLATLGKLSEQIAAVAETQAQLQQVVSDLATQQATLSEQVAYTSSLISRDASLGVFNSGGIPGDSTFRWVGDELVIPGIPISTGKIRITTAVSQLDINNSGGTSSVAAGFSYAVDGYTTLVAGDRACSLFCISPQWVGASVSRVGHVYVTPGSVITVRARAFTWAAGAGANANFSGPRLVVEVVNPN